MVQPSDLSGCSALVTGAGKRIGRAVALSLAAAGSNVVVHANLSRFEAESTAEEIRRIGSKSWVLTADLSELAQAEKLVIQAIKAAGTLDFLVNNASIFEPSLLSRFTLEDLIKVMRVNTFAPLVLGRTFFKQKGKGAIVNFLDTRITTYDRSHAAYQLSKRSLSSLTEMMALEFAPHVRVNAVAPGPILPPPGKGPAYMKRLASTNPLKRLGSTEDVTEAVLYLLKSEFVTGQIIYVDGGYHLKGRTYE
jgi:pteridine reductase